MKKGRLKPDFQFQTTFCLPLHPPASISFASRFLLTFKDYSGLTLNQYGVASPCRTVCGFVALSCFKVNPLYIRTEADSLPIPDKPAQPIAVSVRAEGMESRQASKQYPHTVFLKKVV